MRAVFASALLLLATAPVCAQQTGGGGTEPPPRSAPRQPSGGTPLAAPEEPGARAKRLGDLFAQLRRESAAVKAEMIANRISAEWLASGSATVDLLVQRASVAMAKKDNAAAYDFLDQAIILDPAYAEAWNRRATLNYTADAYGKSLDDIRETLKREPRHFGALLGLAAILEETDRKRRALEVYTKVLEIYPALKPAQEAVGRLSDELAGRAL